MVIPLGCLRMNWQQHFSDEYEIPWMNDFSSEMASAHGRAGLEDEPKVAASSHEERKSPEVLETVLFLSLKCLTQAVRREFQAYPVSQDSPRDEMAVEGGMGIEMSQIRHVGIQTALKSVTEAVSRLLALCPLLRNLFGLV